MPKILADENIHRLLVLNLRYIGLDVLWMGENADRKSTLDLEIVKIANREGRILITCDSDFIRDEYLRAMIKTKVIHIKNGIAKENCKKLADRIKEVIEIRSKALVVDANSLLVFSGE